MATCWAASWPTPVPIAGGLGIAVTNLNQAIIAYANNPSPDNLEILTTAQAQYRVAVANASPAAVLSVMSNDTIVPPPAKLTIGAPSRAASIQVSNGAQLLIQTPFAITGGAIGLSNGAALDLNAQLGSRILFSNNSSNTGGAINTNNSTLSITRASFEGNIATAGNGGAISNGGSGELSIMDSTFTGNRGGRVEQLLITTVL